MPKHLSVISLFLWVAAGVAHAADCDKKVYLTFDTGNMSVAKQVADVLRHHQVKATFFWLMKKPIKIAMR